MGALRWRLADEVDEQAALFSPEDLVGPERSTGRMSGLEFMHVTAKRILNEVPPTSQMPFRWTINAYRGCSHACVYCLAGDTEVLLADGATKQIADLSVGDLVVGTRYEGAHRVAVETEVLAHWPTHKPAYRVHLDGLPPITASGDHRFLTGVGWKFVAPQPRRQYLTRNDSLVRLDGPPVRIRDIEQTGRTLPMFDITTGTGDFIANGVVSHNCFARPTHDYLGLNIGSDFDSKIIVKINAVERLRAELAEPRWTGETIAMGTNTDPYQRAEGKYRLSRGILEALADHANPFSILTKSALVLRDVDVLTRAARRTDVRVNFSIGTLDERVWRATEPGTPHPRRRVEAIRQLSAAGIQTGALIAPVLPGLSDRREQLSDVVNAVTDAGGRVLGSIPLHLRSGTREHFLDWLAAFDPELHTRYVRAYEGRAYLRPEYGRWLTETIRRVRVEASARAR